jgi:hypothetical protein
MRRRFVFPDSPTPYGPIRTERSAEYELHLYEVGHNYCVSNCVSSAWTNRPHRSGYVRRRRLRIQENVDPSGMVAPLKSALSR